MGRVVLLPRPKDPEHDWPQTGRFFVLNFDAVHHNLGPDEELWPDGIPSPWAQMLLRMWRLQDQASPSGKEAVDQLRLVLLLQFLGLLHGQLVRLTPGSQGFGRLAKVMRLLGGDTETLVIWRARSLPGVENGCIIAGSHPSCVFFLGANVEALRLRKALLESHGPGSRHKFLDNTGKVRDPSFAATLAEYLAALANAAGDWEWGKALEPWATELRDLGGRSVPAARSGLALPKADVEFRQWVDVAPWDCPQCVQNGRSWMNLQLEGKPQRLTKTQSTVLCPDPEHRVPIRKNSGVGDPVGYADFGAHRTDDDLYVWVDEGAWPGPRTRPSEISRSADGTGIIRHYFNRQIVEVEGRLVSSNEVILATVAWMARRDGQDPLPVDVPIRAEYVPLLKECSRDDIAKNWLIEFRGRPDIIQVGIPESSARAPWKTSVILVWPPRRVAGWAFDYVAASAPQPPEEKPRTFRIVSQRTDGHFEVSPTRRLLGLYMVKRESAVYIEVGEGTEKEFQPLGLIRVKRDSKDALVPSPGTAKVVLDFGTSNSAVLWRLSGSEKREFVRSGISATDLASRACQVTFSEEWFQNLLRAVAVLLPWYPEDGEPRPFAPSLLAEPSDGTPGGERCIPPRKLGLLTLLGDRPRVVGNLKWGDDWNVPAVRGRIASYLGLLLLPALWDLRTNGVSSYSLKVTYPLAFDASRLAAYRGIITDVLRDLAPLTGLSAPEPDFHSESTAGGALLEEGNMTHEISLDLGGGTLDIAVLVGKAGQALTSSPPGTVLAADSLPYGGRDLLRAVVIAYARFLPHVLRQAGLPLLELDREGVNEQLVNFYLEHLETIIHRGGAAELIQLLQQAPKDGGGPEFVLCKADLRLRWEALLAGLQLYIRAMLHGAIAGLGEKRIGRNIMVNFNLLGQGWELLRLFDPNVAPNKLLTPRLERIVTAVISEESADSGQAIVQPMPKVQNLKTAVVEGADRLPAGAGAQAASGFLSLALAANARNTFVGMSLYSGNREVVKPTLRVSKLAPDLRPDQPGDIGYRHVINRLWTEVPETEQPSGAGVLQLRDRVKHHLLQSSQYRQIYGVQDVEGHVILRGQTTFNKAWPPGPGGVPTTSLLGEFLVKVWKDIWSKAPLR